MKPPVIVSDHALVRYIERVHGVDVEKLRRIIEDQVRPAVAVGASSISAGGFTYMLSSNRVTTVIPGSSPGSAHRGMATGNGRHRVSTRPIRERPRP